MELSGKRLLLLGGTNSAEDIARFAEKHGITLIATAAPRYGMTPLKKISHESYDADAADSAALTRLIRSARIDGVFPGNNEDIMPHAIAAAEACHLPFYCSSAQWDQCANKAEFKKMCRSMDIPVARIYNGEDPEMINYPVAVKPADSCGSQGFSVCREPEGLHAAMENARRFSRTDTVLVEEYIPFDSSIIHYTLMDGHAYFCGISDKHSMMLSESAGSVMALQTFPSEYTQTYLETLDEKVKKMFRQAGLHDGPLWIEAFNDRGRFIFNEMGYRFGGSMTYYPIRYFFGFDQLEFMLRYALSDHPSPDDLNEMIRRDVPEGKKYAILPLHVRPGRICRVCGEEALAAMPEIYAYVPIHGTGDVIRATASVHQVFCYLHILYDTRAELKVSAQKALSSLEVTGEHGESLLFQLYRFDS